MSHIKMVRKKKASKFNFTNIVSLAQYIQIVLPVQHVISRRKLEIFYIFLYQIFKIH